MEYYKKNVSPEFIEYCKTFYNKFNNDEINVDNGRKIVTFHKFEGRAVDRSRKGILEVVNNFLSGTTKCEVTTILNLSEYFKVNTLRKNKKQAEVNLKNINISLQDYKKYINTISNIDIEDIEEFYNKDYRTRNNNIPTDIGYLLKIMNDCNNAIPNKKMDFFRFIIGIAKRGYLIFNYINSKCSYTLICKNLHKYNTSKSTHDDRESKDKNLCGECGKDTKHDNIRIRTQNEEKLLKIKDYLKNINSNFINYDFVTKIVTLTCFYCKDIVDINVVKLFNWTCCDNCSKLNTLRSFLLKKGIYEFTYNEEEEIVTYNCPCCYNFISTKSYELLYNNILCFDCRIYSCINLSYTNIFNIRKSFNTYKSYYNKQEVNILNKYGIDFIPNINDKLSIIITNIKYKKIKRDTHKDIIQQLKKDKIDVCINTKDINKFNSAVYIPSLYLQKYYTYIDIRNIKDFFKESNIVLINFLQSNIRKFKIELWIRDESYIYIIYYKNGEFNYSVIKDIYFCSNISRFTTTEPEVSTTYIYDTNNTNIQKILTVISCMYYTKNIYKKTQIVENIKEVDIFRKGKVYIEVVQYLKNMCIGTINIPIYLAKKISELYFVDRELFDDIIDIISDRLTTFPKITTDYEILRGDYISVSSKSLSIENNTIKTKNLGIKILNHFFIESMLLARKKGSPLIYEEWKDINKRKRLLRRLFIQGRANNRIPKKKMATITPQSLIHVFSCSKDRVYNFSPITAKTLYNYFNAKKVLDFCAGYGGRLLGFWCSNANSYVGIDPNITNNYQNLIDWLRTENKNTKKNIKIIRKPAEEVDFKTLGTFDFIFTSPPYFDIEIYSTEPTQSCIKYPEYTNWLDKFLFKVLSKCIEVLEKNGILAINIKNLPTYKIADDMNNYLSNIKMLERKDDITIIQPVRPHNKLLTKQYEKIYVYKRI